MKFTLHELIISFFAGGIFGLLGYFITRHLNAWLEKVI